MFKHWRDKKFFKRVIDIVEDESGTAYTEAIVALPVLILLFAAIFLIHNMYQAKLIAFRDARETAYLVADSACENSPHQRVELDDTVDEEVESQFNDMDTDSNMDGLSDGAKVRTKRFLNGVLDSLLGKHTVIAIRRGYGAPQAFSQENRHMDASYPTMCNSHRQKPTRFAKEFFCDFSGLC